MIEKRCPFCFKSSFSAYNDPNWICPYCGKNIGFVQSKVERRQNQKEKKIVEFTKGY